MGRRGPRPEPTAVVLAKGNPGKRPLNPDEPQLQTSATTPPADLKARARQEWLRVAPELTAKGVLANADRSLFAEYCKLVAEVEEMERLVKKLGTEAAHQLHYTNYLLKLRQLARQYGAEWGLTGSSRRGVKAEAPKKVPGILEPKQTQRGRFFARKKSGPVVGAIGDSHR